MTLVGIYTIYDGIQLKCSRKDEIEEIYRSTAHNFNFQFHNFSDQTTKQQKEEVQL